MYMYVYVYYSHLEKYCVFSDSEYGSSSFRLSSSLVTVVFMGLLIYLRLLKLWYFIYSNSGLLSGCIFLLLAEDIFEEFWIRSFWKKTQLIMEFLKGLFLSLLFSYYTLTKILMMPSVILLFMLMMLLSTYLSVIR